MDPYRPSYSYSQSPYQNHRLGLEAPPKSTISPPFLNNNVFRGPKRPRVLATRCPQKSSSRTPYQESQAQSNSGNPQQSARPQLQPQPSPQTTAPGGPTYPRIRDACRNRVPAGARIPAYSRSNKNNNNNRTGPGPGSFSGVQTPAFCHPRHQSDRSQHGGSHFGGRTLGWTNDQSAGAGANQSLTLPKTPYPNHHCQHQHQQPYPQRGAMGGTHHWFQDEDHSMLVSPWKMRGAGVRI
jgi:hypothetical protein